jgi:hypothetical protein
VKEELLHRVLHQRRGAPTGIHPARVGEVFGAERATPRDLVQDVRREGVLFGGEAPRPRVGARHPGCHRALEPRPRVVGEGREHAGVGHEVLEGHAGLGRVRTVVAVQVPHEVALAIARHAGAQDEVVHATADVDGVDLHVAVVRERGAYVGGGRAEQRRVAVKSAGVIGGDAER